MVQMNKLSVLFTLNRVKMNSVPVPNLFVKTRRKKINHVFHEVPTYQYFSVFKFCSLCLGSNKIKATII